MAEETKVADNAEMKFTEEELQSLQTLQTNYQEKQAVLGQLAVQKILLNKSHSMRFLILMYLLTKDIPKKR